MAYDNYEKIRVSVEGRTATVMLDQPDIHNAFNDQLINELTQCFKEIGQDDAVRAVVFTGSGKSFCAGADLKWMKSMVNYSKEENIRDSQALAGMFEAVYRCPKPVIARVNGAAFGGGLGLLSACDYVIAVPEAIFSFSEVNLGIAPAVISPYVLGRVKPTHARWLFVSGERFGPERGKDLGLVDEIAPLDAIDETIKGKIKILSSSGPLAMAKNKELADHVPGLSWDEAKEYTIDLIAEMRTSPEGQEGIGAFLEKRRPSWRNE